VRRQCGHSRHELGHYFLDGHVHSLFGLGQGLHQSESGFTSKNPVEREADAFAAGLLMPKTLFKTALAKAGQGLNAI
jgi:Zn-dependent peptidase ImmA (M78 family)